MFTAMAFAKIVVVSGRASLHTTASTYGRICNFEGLLDLQYNLNT